MISTSSGIQKLSEFSNDDLLEAYETLIKERHYSPMGTSESAQDLYDMGISSSDVHHLILERMRASQNP